jgi:hypothetical protein
MNISEIEHLTHTKITDKNFDLSKNLSISGDCLFHRDISERPRSEGVKGRRPDGKSKARPRLEDKSERPHLGGKSKGCLSYG